MGPNRRTVDSGDDGEGSLREKGSVLDGRGRRGGEGAVGSEISRSELRQAPPRLRQRGSRQRKRGITVKSLSRDQALYVTSHTHTTRASHSAGRSPRTHTQNPADGRLRRRPRCICVPRAPVVLGLSGREGIASPAGHIGDKAVGGRDQEAPSVQYACMERRATQT